MLIEMLMAGAVMTAAAVQPASRAAAPAEPARVLRDSPVQIDECKGGGVMQAAGQLDIPRAQKLGDLPRAYLELPVSRLVDGCVAPVRSRTAVGK